ncbi:MAG: hypothetical protein KAH77_08200, partial [Thiomargarita sp.]|nr:hypothetical protein [Thiomargarita sp.]
NPFPNNRSGTVWLGQDSLDIDFKADNIQFETLPKIKNPKIKKPLKPTKHKTFKKHQPHAHSFKEWVSLAQNVTENLHHFIISFSMWFAKYKPFGFAENEHEQFLQAIQKSPRCQGETGRYQELINGEYSALIDTAHHAYQSKLKEVSTPIDTLVDTVHTSEDVWVNFNFETLIKPYLTRDKKIILIDAPLGAGKTTYVKNTFYTENDDVVTSVLLTSIRTLVKKSVADFDANDYEHVKKWKDYEIHAILKGHLATCLNSLGNDKIQKAIPEELDLLFIDEIEHTLEAIFTGTVKRSERSELLGLLGLLISKAKFVVFAQHGITPLTLKFIEYFGYKPKDCVLLKNTHKRFKDLPCNFYQQESVLLTHLHNTVQKGERVIVATNSIKTADRLEIGLKKKYPEKRILKLTADTTGKKAVQSFLKDPTAACEHYDVIIYSPVLCSGFSLEHPDFKRTFGFFTSNVLTPSDCIQMLFRNRMATEIDFFCDLELKSFDVEDHIFQAHTNFEFNKHNSHLDENNRAIITDSAMEVLILHAEVLKKQSQENARFYENFYLGLRQGMGCKVNFVDGDGDKEGIRVNKEAGVMRKSLTTGDILQAPKIDATEYQYLNDDDPTAFAKKKRYQFEHTMRVDIGDVSLLNEAVTSQDERVDGVNQYLENTPDIALAFTDYNEGKLTKHHLLISEACTPEKEAWEYHRLLAKHMDTVYLDSALKNSFWLRWNLFNLLIPLIHLKAENWGLVPTDSENFSYADVLKDKALMDFCHENRSALQACNLSKMTGAKPTVVTIGNWVRDMGLHPKTTRVLINGKQVSMKNWGDFEYPVTRLLTKYNAIFDGLNEAEDCDSVEKHYQKAAEKWAQYDENDYGADVPF